MKSEISLFLAVPHTMEAFGSTNYSNIDISNYHDADLGGINLEKALDISEKGKDIIIF